MPTAANKSQFDVMSFRKFVRLMDSPVEGERHAALYQALKLCAQHRPPLLFFEAAALALGNNQGERDALLDKAARLQVEVDDLTSRLQQREAEAAQLADRFVEAKRTIEQLISESRKKAGDGSHDFGILLDDLWALPPIRLLLVTGVISAEVIADWKFESAFNPALLFLLNIVFWFIELRLFAKWTSLQFRRDGLLQLLIKWLIFGSGLCVRFCLSSTAVSGASSYWMALAALAAFSVLTISRLSEWLVEDLGKRLWNPIRFKFCGGASDVKRHGQRAQNRSGA